MVEAHGYRRLFDAELAEIDHQVQLLFTLVTGAVGGATAALLASDRATAQETCDQDAAIDQLRNDIEHLVQLEFLRQSPMAKDMRYLLSVMRVVPELERSGDLAGHIARRALAGLASRLTPEVQGFLRDMGATSIEMWQAATAAWSERDAGAAVRIDTTDDRLDDLHDQLLDALLRGDLERDDALQATLVGRFYERLGDHAVHISERIGYLVGV